MLIRRKLSTAIGLITLGSALAASPFWPRTRAQEKIDQSEVPTAVAPGAAPKRRFCKQSRWKQ